MEILIFYHHYVKKTLRSTICTLDFLKVDLQIFYSFYSWKKVPKAKISHQHFSVENGYSHIYLHVGKYHSIPMLGNFHGKWQQTRSCNNGETRVNLMTSLTWRKHNFLQWYRKCSFLSQRITYPWTNFIIKIAHA